MSRRSRFPRRIVNTSASWFRTLTMLLAAVILGTCIALLLTKLSPQVAELTGEHTATGQAADVLGTLNVDDSANPGGYDRDLFGFRKTDANNDGCDVREDILARDLSDVRYKYRGSCTVASGILHDPYTGATIHFTRGVKTSSAVQIDHVVALENAWRSGANTWDTSKRYAFANDPYNLLAVDGPANQSKGSASAAYWLPTNSAYRCEYVARQIGVKAKYSLSVTSNEKTAMLAILHACPAQEIPQ